MSSFRIDFMIAGAQKGGTTALDAYLRTHDEVCMSNVKEVHYFDRRKYFRRRLHRPLLTYGPYHKHFNPHPQHRVVGEATPDYLYWQDAPRRIWRYHPGIKLIFILRNPIERAYSHWQMNTRLVGETMPFMDALLQEEERCRAARPFQHRTLSYVDRGRYTEQLRRFWHFFPREQTLVLRNKQLRHNPQATLDEVTRFIGVNPFPPTEHKEVGSGDYTESMPDDARTWLKDVFENEIREIERVFGWDCTDWRR